MAKERIDIVLFSSPMASIQHTGIRKLLAFSENHVKFINRTGVELDFYGIPYCIAREIEEGGTDSIVKMA